MRPPAPTCFRCSIAWGSWRERVPAPIRPSAEAVPLTAVFVRHGESTANVDRVFANRLDNPAPLTPVGFAQAESLVRVLGPFAITHVYTSPLARARQTAAVIAGAFGVTCTIVDAMREYDV